VHRYVEGEHRPRSATKSETDLRVVASLLEESIANWTIVHTEIEASEGARISRSQLSEKVP
jgi:hypothetical protein